MEKAFDPRTILNGTFDFVTCIRPNGTYYGNGGAVCRRGAEAELPSRLGGHPIFERLSPAQNDALAKSLLDFQVKLSNAGYQPDALEDWDAAQAQMLDGLNGSGGAKGTGEYAYTADEVVAKAQSQLERAENLMVNKMPTHLDNGSGTFTEASLSMEPAFGASQLKWKDPVLGDKYGSAQYTREKGIKDAERSAAKAEKAGDKNTARIYRERADNLRKLPEGSTLVVKNGVAASRFSQWQEGNASKMLAFKAEQEAAGKPWPMAPMRQPTQKEIDDLVKANPNMWRSGFNIMNQERGRDDAFDVYEAGSKNPSPRALAARTAKSQAMAASYLSYDGKSPVTGESIKVPLSKAPTTKTVVDHVTAYRDIVKANPGKSIFELDAIANTRENFMNVEADLNNSKGERSWGRTASNLAKGQTATAVRDSVTNNWNERGSRVTLSAKQYEKRFGTLNGFQSPSDRQAIASAYEQQRLSKIFGVPRSEMVPTARNRNSPPVSEGFTPPRGTVMKPGTGGVSRPTASPRSTRAAAAPNTRVTRQRADRTASRAQSKASMDVRKRDAALEKLSKTLDKKRADQRKYKPGSAAFNRRGDAVNKAATELRKFKKDNDLL